MNAIEAHKGRGGKSSGQRPRRLASAQASRMPSLAAPTGHLCRNGFSSWVPMTDDQMLFAAQVSSELSLPEASVRAVLRLLAEGGSVHFIARYRKEATVGMDEVQIRQIEERHTYLTELSQRRAAILAEVEKQGKLTEELRQKLTECQSKAELEDLYLPFKPKRRTRGMIAEEKGLLPLAELIWSQPSEGNPEQSAASFLSEEHEITETDAALAGARDILAERIGEVAELRAGARQLYLDEGVISVEKTRAHAEQVTKFDNYAEFTDKIGTIASHRYLAIRRGESEGVLRASLRVETENFISRVERETPINSASPWAEQLRLACREAATRQLLPKAQVDVRVELKMQSDRAAIEVFATNLKQLLMAAPLGSFAVLGIDPGQRTGCKCAVVDQTGKVLAHETIYLVKGDAALRQAEEIVAKLLAHHPIRAVAIGNGTHGRETETFVKGIIAKQKTDEATLKPFCVSVSESGASVYSASEVAREEFPDLDLTVRGAISIARRLQDPLAELVKVDPKSIGVGQYQHDVLQTLLEKKLGEVVSSCVHEVGVELNTASAPLLSHVSGLGSSLAKRIVSFRNEQGAFRERAELLKVPGLGPRAFEQAAGFLRIRDAENPLDTSGVHPERYELVEKMAADLSVSVKELIKNAALLERLDKSRYASGDVGHFTLDDIIAELRKPGRDPRETFEAPQFREDVSTLEDLELGMRLQGVITNVTAFGAFVDIGVHQDGLVHISELSDKFIRDPSEVAKVGDRLTVTVLEIDLVRKRIGLSAKTVPGRSAGRAQGERSAQSVPGHRGTEHQGRGASQRAGGEHKNAGQRAGAQASRAGVNGRGQTKDKLTHNPFAALKQR